MKIKDLLTDESKWTKGADARSDKEESLNGNVFSPKAVKFCLYGAIMVATAKADKTSD